MEDNVLTIENLEGQLKRQQWQENTNIELLNTCFVIPLVYYTSFVLDQLKEVIKQKDYERNRIRKVCKEMQQICKEKDIEQMLQPIISILTQDSSQSIILNQVQRILDCVRRGRLYIQKFNSNQHIIENMDKMSIQKKILKDIRDTLSSYEEQDLCPICIDSINEDIKSCNKCKKKYHNNCIETMKQQGDMRCPNCREQAL